MKRYFACLVLPLVFAGVCWGQYFDRIAPLKDAPFSAEVQGSYTSRDSSSTWNVAIARAGDGSVYEATFDPFGEFKGTIKNIKIEDVTSNCNISISPYRSHLAKTGQGHEFGATWGLSIGLEARKALTSPEPTVEDIRDRNLREQERISMNPSGLKPDAKMRQTSLGQKTVDGVTIFGYKSEHALDSKTDRIDERWESELGFAYSSISTHPSEGRVSANSVAGLKLGEPPAELFSIQDKYFPPTGTLPNAKTIFISEVPGSEELTHRIESILTDSGRFTLAPESTAADLVVLPKFDSDTPGDHTHGSSRQIRLEVKKPNGVDLFWVTLRLNGASEQWAQSPVVNSCFANLWNRVEGLKAPPPSLDEALF